MRQSFIAILFFLPGMIASAQAITEDTYCIKLKKPTSDRYFSGAKLDTIPDEGRMRYEKGFRDWGKLLSRFNEEALIDSTTEVFRAVTFGSYNTPNDLQIRRIEKVGSKVVITIKFIEKLKDSTVMVHRKTLGPEVWDQFGELAEKYIISQPFTKKTPPVHDGSTTVFEGYLSGRYHLLIRSRMSMTDPDLEEVNSFLFRNAGPIYGVNCKKDTREN